MVAELILSGVEVQSCTQWLTSVGSGLSTGRGQRRDWICWGYGQGNGALAGDGRGHGETLHYHPSLRRLRDVIMIGAAEQGGNIDR